MFFPKNIYFLIKLANYCDKSCNFSYYICFDDLNDLEYSETVTYFTLIGRPDNLTAISSWKAVMAAGGPAYQTGMSAIPASKVEISVVCRWVYFLNKPERVRLGVFTIFIHTFLFLFVSFSVLIFTVSIYFLKFVSIYLF